MKQLIVLIATILLGVIVAGFIVGLGDSAEDLSDAGTDKIAGAITNEFK